jgi:excisionase family DNA binding protein
MDDGKRWLTPTELAEYLSVSKPGLSDLVKSAKLPPPSYQLGPRSPRWDRLAIDAHMAGGARDPRWVPPSGLADALLKQYAEKNLRGRRPTGALAETELGRRQLAAIAARKKRSTS